LNSRTCWPAEPEAEYLAAGAKKSLERQEMIVDEFVHREQFDRGDADVLQVLDDRGIAEPGIGATLVFRDIGMKLGQSLHMGFIDDRFQQWPIGRLVALPVE
jgi:hypothetical protein